MDAEPVAVARPAASKKNIRPASTSVENFWSFLYQDLRPDKIVLLSAGRTSSKFKLDDIVTRALDRGEDGTKFLHFV